MHKINIPVCVCCSQVQEHGDGRGVTRLMPARLPKPPGGGAKSWLAEEAAQHHEELAAPLVCAALGPALLLQRRGGNQAPGQQAPHANIMVCRQLHRATSMATTLKVLKTASRPQTMPDLLWLVRPEQAVQSDNTVLVGLSLKERCRQRGRHKHQQEGIRLVEKWVYASEFRISHQHLFQ